jgi:hypothetical protein
VELTDHHLSPSEPASERPTVTAPPRPLSLTVTRHGQSTANAAFAAAEAAGALDTGITCRDAGTMISPGPDATCCCSSPV